VTAGTGARLGVTGFVATGADFDNIAGATGLGDCVEFDGDTADLDGTPGALALAAGDDFVCGIAGVCCIVLLGADGTLFSGAVTFGFGAAGFSGNFFCFFSSSFFFCSANFFCSADDAGGTGTLSWADTVPATSKATSNREILR